MAPLFTIPLLCDFGRTDFQASFRIVNVDVADLFIYELLLFLVLDRLLC